MSNIPSRTATPSRDTGSHTIQETQPNPVLRLNAPSGVLRLRAEPEDRRHIQWAEDVVDNEGMGKKSSKGKLSSFENAGMSSCIAPEIASQRTVFRIRQRLMSRQYAVSTTRPAKPANPATNPPATVPQTRTQTANQTTAQHDRTGVAANRKRTTMIMGMGVSTIMALARGTASRKRGSRRGHRVRMRMRKSRSRRT